MSEEMNNPEKTTRDDFSEEIRKALAAPDSKKPTLEEFKLMVYKDREKRRKKRNAAVAGIVVALMAGFFAFDTLVPEVGADKNPKEEIITEDGVIIEDGGYGSSDGEDNIWIIEDWKDIKDVKEIIPQILMPEYVPENYVFEKLIAKRIVENDFTCEYVFYDNGGNVLEIEILFTHGGESAMDVRDVIKKIETNNGDIYVLNGEKKTATMQLDDGTNLIIWGDISEKELIKVINGLVY